MTDVLGELSQFGDGQVTVQTRNGPVVVPMSEIVAAKRIPPRVTRTPRGPDVSA